MAGYLGTKAVLLSTTAADVIGNAEIGGSLTVGGNLTSTGIDDNATSTAMTLDASGNVTVNSNGSVAALDGISGIQVGNNAAATSGLALETSNRGYLWYIGSGTSSLKLWDSTANSDRLTITSSGGIEIPNQNAVNELTFTGTEYTNLYSETTAGFDVGTTSSSGSSYLRFLTENSEAMRINSAGHLLVGKTSSGTITTSGMELSPNYTMFSGSNSGSNPTMFVGANGASGYLVNFYYGGASVGNITTNGSATAYSTASDYRLKTDAQPMTGASARVQALKPVNFEWISTGERVDGFLAHEAQAVVPEAVTGTKDAMRDEEYEVTPAVYEDVVIPAVLDEEGNELEAERTEQRLVSEAVMGTRSVPDYQGIDQSKLVPLLTAALQEALTEISDLKARVTALEAV